MHMIRNWHLKIVLHLLVNNTLIDNAEDLDIVMPMCNLKVQQKLLKTAGSL